MLKIFESVIKKMNINYGKLYHKTETSCPFQAMSNADEKENE